ncbi:MAG: hypothetical protein JWQ35_1204 [Bacteriovoracaceae bacterium]|nr:hypothetical protein [Bacteriovoracaceae bacterium]
MEFYRDYLRETVTSDEIQRLESEFRKKNLKNFEPNIHSHLSRLLIETGELSQGLLDDEFKKKGADDWTVKTALCSKLTLEAAKLFTKSYHFLENPRTNDDPKIDSSKILKLFRKLSTFNLPSRLKIKIPEGYSYYSLYPEQYLLAAKKLRERSRSSFVVIGIRSIGTSLASLVAAVLDSQYLPFSFRPIGEPFDRKLKTEKRLLALMQESAKSSDFAVVDEGPGISGSSFGAVVSWLTEKLKIDVKRIHLFPSHDADPAFFLNQKHKKKWKATSHYVYSFEDLVRTSFQKYIFPKQSSCEELSAGNWRSLLFKKKNQWPPSNPFQERRKYLISVGKNNLVAKFVGLGRLGEEAFKRAKILESDGLAPPVHSYSYGYLTQNWLSAASPLSAASEVDRDLLLQTLGRYIQKTKTFRAKELSGTSVQELYKMSHQLIKSELNISTFGRWAKFLPAILAEQKKVKTDNKMQNWEWLILPSGKILKTDGLDHYRSHEGIGAQDIEWDIAGAIVELNLNESEETKLDRLLGISQRNKESLSVRNFYRETYLAIQLGICLSSASKLAATYPLEAQRFRALARQYSEKLLLCF